MSLPHKFLDHPDQKLFGGHPNWRANQILYKNRTPDYIHEELHVIIMITAKINMY